MTYVSNDAIVELKNNDLGAVSRRTSAVLVVTPFSTKVSLEIRMNVTVVRIVGSHCISFRLSIGVIL